ncbi:MAG: hypothetical protein PVJ51_07875, partial [Acidobacteriota bacterium]
MNFTNLRTLLIGAMMFVAGLIVAELPAQQGQNGNSDTYLLQTRGVTAPDDREVEFGLGPSYIS